jgi:hypothetical protein
MYAPVTSKSGVGAVSDWFSQFTPDATNDGLELSPTAGSDVQLLPSLTSVNDIPTTGKSLVIVASVSNVLHFRVFDGDGATAVDTDEDRLPDAATLIAKLKVLLTGLWGVAQLSQSQKDSVAAAVAPIVGFAPPIGSVPLPDALRSWLLDLRLLRRVPLCYLVPDARLLPPESIRFFNVDQMWIDRLIDGVYSAATVGTVDVIFTYGFLGAVRNALDDDLAKLASTLSPDVPWRPGDDPMTGCLIRSELVRRWPDLIVTAYQKAGGLQQGKIIPPTSPLAVLRAETLSPDIFIALFGGMPKQVQITEPRVGMRFGVDVDNNGKNFIHLRQADGSQDGTQKYVDFENAQRRTLNFSKLLSDIPKDKKYQLGTGPRTIAIQFERPAQVQDFVVGDETQGSVSPFHLVQQFGQFLPLPRGQQMSLEKFTARLTAVDPARRV